MESVEEENDENADPENNVAYDEDEVPDDNVAKLCYEIPSNTKKLNAITVSDKLSMACLRYVTENSCSLPNCEYSHDRDIVAAARNKQMADLTCSCSLDTWQHCERSTSKPSFQPIVVPAPNATCTC